MNTRNSIPAFTVMEFTISMVIASLVIGIGYQAAGMFSSRIKSPDASRLSEKDLLTLNYVIGNDIQSAEHVLCDKNEFTCVFSDHNIVYVLSDNNVIRNLAAAADTFKIGVVNHECLLQHEITSTGFVDQLKIQALINEIEYPLHFVKSYDAMTLMSIEQDEGN